MEIALTPREIQARIRSGASVAEVAAEAGVEESRIQGFAGPVLAEREHMARTALSSTVRRRGDGTGHRRLRDIIRERLQARGIDSDRILWDSRRRADLKWQLIGVIEDESAPRSAEFVFDHRGRFSVADNADARWMIGEELPGAEGPDDENTVDFNDELALVRATQDQLGSPAGIPGDDVPQIDSPYDDSPQTSELDDLYDMMSGISEDSVRIYVGLEDEPYETPEDEAEAEQQSEPVPVPDPDEEQPELEPLGTTAEQPAVAEQDSLIEDPEGHEPAAEQAKPRSRRRRAKVPTWDEIMFGGGSKES